MTYKTNYKRTPSKTPAAFVGKTAAEIVEYMRKNFDTEIDLDTGYEAPANVDTAFFYEVADLFFDPANWKSPFIAFVPGDSEGRDISQVVAAVSQWYHGAAIDVEIKISNYGVISPGYVC